MQESEHAGVKGKGVGSRKSLGRGQKARSECLLASCKNKMQRRTGPGCIFKFQKYRLAK